MTESAVFYEKESEGLGSAFLDEIERAITKICDHKEIGRLYIGNIRQYTLTRFPYSILYLVENQEIIVVAIAHHRRKPGFWRNR